MSPEEVTLMIASAQVAAHLFLLGLGTYLAHRWWGKRGRKVYLIYGGINLVVAMAVFGANPLLLLILVKVFHFRKSQLERYKKGGNNEE